MKGRNWLFWLALDQGSLGLSFSNFIPWHNFCTICPQHLPYSSSPIFFSFPTICCRYAHLLALHVHRWISVLWWPEAGQRATSTQGHHSLLRPLQQNHQDQQVRLCLHEYVSSWVVIVTRQPDWFYEFLILLTNIKLRSSFRQAQENWPHVQRDWDHRRPNIHRPARAGRGGDTREPHLTAAWVPTDHDADWCQPQQHRLKGNSPRGLQSVYNTHD